MPLRFGNEKDFLHWVGRYGPRDFSGFVCISSVVDGSKSGGSNSEWIWSARPEHESGSAGRGEKHIITTLNQILLK